MEITAVAEKIGLVQKESKRKHVTGNPEKCLQRKLNAVMKFAMQASCHSWNRNVPTSHYLDTHFYPLLIRSQPDSQPIILNNLTGHGSTKIWWRYSKIAAPLQRLAKRFTLQYEGGSEIKKASYQLMY